MNKKKFKIIMYILLFLGVFLFVFPFVYMMIGATQTNAMITSIPPSMKFGGNLSENFNNLQERYNVLNAFKNTIIITIVGTASVTFLTTMSGYAFAKFQFSGRDKLFRFLLYTTMIPAFSTIVPLFIIFAKLGLINSYLGLILPSFAAVSSIFLMRQYMKAIPDELIESARIDGASEFMIFLKICVPTVIPGIITVALLIFLGYWNSYLWPLLATTSDSMQTMSLMIRNMGLSAEDLDYGMRYLALVISIIPVLIVYCIVQFNIKENNIGSAIK